MTDTPIPLDPKLAEIARNLGVDPSKPMTVAQAEAVTAITLAVGVLNEGHIPYTLLASPDAPSKEMKILGSHRLSYSTDLETIGKETPLTRNAILWAALTTLSVGLKGGIVLIDQEGTPLCAFDGGKVRSLKQASPVRVEKEVVS